ncbi:hypothetical protein NLX85_20240 [Micromonospora sp. A3M-1-15]|uniref:hypothetical protein n=1 Tax=Micromonospora sp. A3M-1-15 TaxID=2962035 RepID=UPI0020B81E80|nr:hypothetical protein [Micromonospora sp. A3M-1-15]MCP3785697.1 hypothetical protein [Micromonospora sp. A3M-1-15]
MRRSLVPALALGLAALLTACGTADDAGPAPAASASASTVVADPVAAVRQGFDRSLEQTAKLDVLISAAGQTITMTSAVEPDTGRMTLHMKTPDPVTVVVTEDAVYIRQDDSAGKPWLKLDRDRLRPDGQLAQGLDFRAQAGILGGVVSAERTGDGRYTGVADSEKAIAAAGSESQRAMLRRTFKVLKQKSVPFEATLDAEGRLTLLTYTFDTAAGAIRNELKLHSFGEPLAISAPQASETEDATADVYQVF